MQTYSPEEIYDYSETSNEQQCDTSEINDFSKTFLPPFYYVIFIVSVLGNGVVLLVMYKFEKLTVTNIFLFNLVASNVIFTFTLPFRAVYHGDQWIFGDGLCKFVHSACYLGFYSSILFLTLMTFDRYLAVVHCVVANKQRKNCYAVVLSIIVWSISFISSLEPLFHFGVVDSQLNGMLCEDLSSSQWKAFGIYKQFVFFFVFPLAVFVYCYIRITLTVISSRMAGKYRTVRLIFVIVLLFFACWSPYNIILIIKENKVSQQCDDTFDYALYITTNIAHLYFCINPVLYTFLGRKFQNHVRSLLVKKVPCFTQYITVSASSRSLEASPNNR